MYFFLFLLNYAMNCVEEELKENGTGNERKRLSQNRLGPY
jgi:hypothetical protein